MLTTVQYDHRPTPVRYMPCPDGKADVWIRNDIRQEDDGEGGTIWAAEEVFLRTAQSRENVMAQAGDIFLRVSGVQAELTQAVQRWMDGKAQERGYDNIASACSYIQSTDSVFRSEAEACVSWRDVVWRHCYSALDDVRAGQRAIPTKEELLAELPVLVWPDEEEKK